MLDQFIQYKKINVRLKAIKVFKYFFFDDTIPETLISRSQVY